jgi:hypothetical protein
MTVSTYFAVIMKTFFAALLFLSTACSWATSSHNVRGYTKKDGTYVAPHRATNPNKTQRDNWSSKPNTNPYNGKQGTKEPKK